MYYKSHQEGQFEKVSAHTRKPTGSISHRPTVIGQLVLVQVELIAAVLCCDWSVSTVIGAFRSAFDAESSQLTKFRA